MADSFSNGDDWLGSALGWMAAHPNRSSEIADLGWGISAGYPD